MASGGFYWYNDGPEKIAQKFSIFAEELGPKLGAATSRALSNVEQDMKGRILELGRIRTGAMFNSVSTSLSVAPGGVRAQYGYILGQPLYTKYQEFGTRYIMATHAFVNASAKLYADLKREIDLEDIWSGLR